MANKEVYYDDKRKLWKVEINHYPHSRSYETWEFDKRDEAMDFFEGLMYKEE